MVAMPARDEFDERELEHLEACPFCHSHARRNLFTEKGFPLVECCRCTLMYLATRVRQQYLHKVYDADYHAGTNIEYSRRVAEKRLSLITALHPGALVVEDGAGVGAFVAECIARGHVVVGCDLSPSAASMATSLFSVRLHHGSAASVGLAPSSVDLFACFNLLGHIYEPWRYIEFISTVLKPEGSWLFRTGNRRGVMKSIHRGSWGAPEHVYHYNRRILDTMCTHAGLKIVRSFPAFDSDFPYLFFQYSRRRNAFFRRVGAVLCSLTSITWTKLHLPKEDEYFIAKKTS